MIVRLLNSRLVFSSATLLLLATLAAPCVYAAETEALLEAVAQGEEQQRLAALDDLGELQADAELVVPQLIELLNDSSVQVRWHSARALGSYGTAAQSAAPALRDRLANDEPIVKYHAAAALGKIGDSSEATIQALVAEATHEDERIARIAIAAIGKLNPSPELTASVLADALRSGEEETTLYALEAIVAAGGKATPLLKESLQRPETAYLACVAIHEIGPDASGAVPELAELIRTTVHSKLLIEALLALASVGPEGSSAASAVLPHLESSNDATVPVAAAYALGAIDASTSDVDQPLRKAAAQDDNFFLQMVAAWSLAKLNPDNDADLKRAVNSLTQGLSNDDPMIRTAAANCLQKLEAPPEMVAPLLMKLANDPNPAVSANVVEALASLGEKIVPRAVAALSNPERQPLALRVLSRMGRQASSAVPELIAALDGASPQSQAEINLVFAAIGPDAAPATEALAAALDSQDPRVRHTALRALHDIGPAAAGAKASLLELMEDADPVDSVLAAWALAAVAGDDASVVARIVPVLQEGARHADAELRERCSEALSALGASGS